MPSLTPSDGRAGYQMRFKDEMTLMKRMTFRFLIVAAVSLSLWMTRGAAVATASAGSEGAAYSASWRVTGPTGGDVRGLVVDPNDASRLYFGTLDGQIYTSTDGGNSWRLLTNFNRPHLFVDHIIVDPRNSKVLYVEIGRAHV